ncbi:pilus assembly protein PilM [Blautia sp.]
MAKSCLGIDIGKDQLKLVLMKGETIQKAVSVQMPEGLLKEGRIVSVETTGELIRKTMKENKIRCKEAAVVVSSGICFLRNVTMPEMTADQLVYNLPYEFRDYITDELKKYAFDYSWGSPEELPKAKKPKKQPKKKKGEEKPDEKAEDSEERRGEMELLAAAAPLEAIDDLRLMARKAGLKLTFAAPEVSACENLLHYKLKEESDKDKEYGILDLGSTSSRLLIFKGDRHQVTRIIERGMEQVEELLADSLHIDIHLAHTWLLTNHEDCVNSEVCQDAFSQISVELMRALNFYQFSNPDSRLEDIYICGGGASIESMRESLKENLDVTIHDASELMDGLGGGRISEVPSLWMLAAGTALGRTAKAPKKQINLAFAGQKKKHYWVAVPAIGGIVMVAGVIGKVAVADRLVQMSEAQSAVSQMQQQVDDITAYIDSFGDLQETYAHYTYQGLTGDELSFLNRPEVLKLMTDIIFPKVMVSSWSVSGNQLSLPVTGENLSDINSLVQELEQEPIVDYCNVMTAVTDGNTETEAAADKVTGQIVIYLLDPLTVQEQDGSTDVNETGAAVENTDAGTANSGSTETGSGFADDGADAESTATDTAADADTAAGAADDGFEDGTEGGAQ